MGQEREVEVHRFFSEPESYVVEVLRRKDKSFMDLYDNVPWQVHCEDREDYTPSKLVRKEGDGWVLYCGDSVDSVDHVEDESVGLSVFSPPFPGMYVYTDSPA